jgi:hypothetical protein
MLLQLIALNILLTTLQFMQHLIMHINKYICCVAGHRPYVVLFGEQPRIYSR